MVGVSPHELVIAKYTVYLLLGLQYKYTPILCAISEIETMARVGKQTEVVRSRVEVGKRITEFYTHELGIKRQEFARLIDVRANTLRHYEGGVSEPGSVFFSKVREKFPSVDIGYLLTGKRTVIEGVDPDILAPMRRIPVVTAIPVGGFPNGVPDSAVVQTVFTSELKNPKIFGLLVRGDSMLPEFKDGTVIVVVPVADPIEGSQYVVVRSSGDLLYGRFSRVGRDVKIVSSDPKRMPDTIKPTEAVSFFMGIENSRKML